MKLATWLDRTKTPQSVLADAIGVTQGRVSQISRGSEPSIATAAKIVRATNGAVQLEDLVKDEVGAESAA